MPVDQGGAPPSRGIRVELDGLTDFAGQVRAETDSNLRPRAHEAVNQFGQGVPFGERAIAPGVQVAQEIYRQSLVSALDALDAYVAAADAMATAAETVAKRYGATDAMAAANADLVSRELARALNRVPPVPDTATDGGAAPEEVW
ncbi:hypothetical protein [Pilimelia columellifera]|uniref:Uncharacterized protein n=1 Tax=Pilimelia columellifera subsp. columellifera TaxID=706583 RepID=A0ABN3N490_9ACTN